MKRFFIFLMLFMLFATAPQITAQTFMSGFTENFNSSGSTANFTFGTGGDNRNTWTNGAASEIEPAARVMRLALHPDNAANPWQGPNFTSKNFTRFGRYSARIKIPGVASQPSVGGVVGFFTYYNDLYNNELPKDENKNGVSDNSEIDFEWLIANPQLVYMTAWTDQEEDGTCRKVARIVNLAAGAILTTNYAEKVGSSGTRLTGEENQPATIRSIPGFDASEKFYVYGFDWKTDNVRWWILNPEDETDTMVLWDYKGNSTVQNSRIPQKSTFLMFNFWHTNNWSAEGKPGSTQKPTSVFYADFDWIRYETLADISTSIAGKNITASTKTAKTAGASIVNRRLNLSFPAGVNTANAALYDVRGRLLFERDIAVTANNASVALPASIAKNQMVILRVKTNAFSFAKRLSL